MTQINNIGILHYQVGYTDGVSLEIDKWGQVLEKLGYRVNLCAGDLGGRVGHEIPELYHHHPEIIKIGRNAFSALDDYNPVSLLNEITTYSRLIEFGLEKFVQEKQIDLLIVNNVWSVGLNLPAAIALEKVRKKYALPTLAHHHDFYWERKTDNKPTCSPIEKIAADYLPPQNSSIKHLVINSLAQKTLAHHKHLQARVIPNVFDFDAPTWTLDSYNQDLRQRIGLDDSDIMVLQATRVIPRKAIELSIDLINALNASERRSKLIQSGLYNGKSFSKSSRIVLVMTGSTKDDVSGNYINLLKEKAQACDVELLHIADLIETARGYHYGDKRYSFWDGYAVADLVTYPSLWEGWGNQLLEAVQARLPVVLFEYPVYLEDIQEKGFSFISLGSKISGKNENGLVQVDQEIIEQAADEVLMVLTDEEKRHEMLSHNHQVAQAHYSLQTLESILSDLVTT